MTPPAEHRVEVSILHTEVVSELVSLLRDLLGELEGEWLPHDAQAARDRLQLFIGRMVRSESGGAQ